MVTTLIVIGGAAVLQAVGLWVACRFVRPAPAPVVISTLPYPRVPSEFVSGEWKSL